jgi:hypothetical protein
MTNTVVIQSVTRIGDAVTVAGTVNGQATQCQVWQSELNTLPSVLSQQNYLAQQLVASLPPTPIPLPNLIPPGPVTV